MYSSLAVLLATVAVAADADKLKCSMVPVNTEDGLMGYCCVFFKDTRTAEAQTKQIINMFAKKKKDNEKVNVEYKPSTPRSDIVTTIKDSAMHNDRRTFTVDEIQLPKQSRSFPIHSDTFFPGDTLSNQNYKADDSVSDTVNVTKDGNTSVTDSLKPTVKYEVRNLKQTEAGSVLHGSNAKDKLKPHPEYKTDNLTRNTSNAVYESDSNRTFKESDTVNESTTTKIIELIPGKDRPTTLLNIPEYRILLPVKETTINMEEQNRNHTKIEKTTASVQLEHTTEMTDIFFPDDTATNGTDKTTNGNVTGEDAKEKGRSNIGAKEKSVNILYFPKDAVRNGTDKTTNETVTGDDTKEKGKDCDSTTGNKDESSDNIEPKVVLTGRNKDDVPETCTEGQAMDVNGECIDKF